MVRLLLGVCLLLIAPVAVGFSLLQVMPGEYWAVAVALFPYIAATAPKAVPLPLEKWLRLHQLEALVAAFSVRSIRTGAPVKEEIQVQALFEFAAVDKYAELKVGRKETVKLIEDVEDRLLQGIIPGVVISILLLLMGYVTYVYAGTVPSGGVAVSGQNPTLSSANPKHATDLLKLSISLISAVFIFSRLVHFIGDRRKKNGELVR